ncbi:hypothetical protein PV410_09915 [Streptomyces sp. PA03-5A]|nr:hypothetical protein [Streptomyces sp. PA03-5A]
MRGDFVKAVPKVPCALAVCCLLLTLGVAWFLYGQVRGADRIDASAVRVDGVIEEVTFGRGASARVGYEVAGRPLVDRDLPVSQMPGRIAVGARLCLEAAADHPRSVRLCGRRYPAGDDMPPTAVLGIVAGTAGTLCAAAFAVSGYRDRRPQASGRPASARPPAAEAGVR